MLFQQMSFSAKCFHMMSIFILFDDNKEGVGILGALQAKYFKN